jgi:diguanylate cyclase (GGDEF)-like protein
MSLATLQQQFPWVLLGAGVAIVLYFLFRPRRRDLGPSRQPQPSPTDRELHQLRDQVRHLEGRYHAQVEFFVNFPEVVRTLTAALSTGQVLSACSRGASALLRTREIAIFLAGNGRLRLVDGAGFPPWFRGQLTCAVEDLGPLLEYHGVSALRSLPGVHQALQGHNLGWDLGVPIWYGGRLLGMILVGNPEGEPDFAQRVLAMLADLTAVGLHAASKVDEIKDRADRDALTGLANRRTLESWVTHALQRCQSYRSPLSVAMIDVDHFKHYNDTNGHQAGDEALKTVAKLLATTTRRTDLVARYGGEEFTVVLAGADATQAMNHAERIRDTIASHTFPHGQKQPLGGVTISIGVATFPDSARDLGGLIEAADKALYQAKEQGRNRVVCYDGPILDDRDSESVVRRRMMAGQ